MPGTYNFDGGDLLKSMGASWFVSYYYYLEKDSSHTDWNNVKSTNRISIFRNTKKYHQFWLQKVVGMNESSLKKATFGVTPEQTKRMARELLGQ